MKKVSLKGVILFLGILGFNYPAASGQADTTNLAFTASVSTSFVSSWETLESINDGFDPLNSADYSHGAYGNWNGESAYNTYNWVQYNWTLARQLTSTSVFWWDDSQGIDQPANAYVEYWNGSAWIMIGAIGCDLDTYNSLKLDIFTSGIRISMVSPMATGILEWRVFGVDTGPCDPTEVITTYRVNDEEVVQGSTIHISDGDSLQLIPEAFGEGTYIWMGPDGFTKAGRILTLKDFTWHETGTYSVNFLNDCGATTICNYIISFKSDAPITWPAYNPGISYDFRDEYPDLDEPTMDLDDCPGVVGTQSSGWWTFKWGADANLLVTSAAITPMLERMNRDFAYFRNVMGWPPDKRAKNGYRSAIYLYGSGLCTDNASNTATGGWQSSISYNGQSWPMVLISYYPVYCFDPSCSYGDRSFQMGAVVHEGIHSILADLPGCKQAAWFHEGGNTWLQQEAEARQTGNYSTMGFLNGASFLAPFMPIECYSGWLQDDSFGGPSAEGVNMSEGGTQICTWRNLLGGVQYSNIFPTFLGMTLGQGSIPWIWRNCPSRVLEGMAAGLGESQIRRLIMEYRAKQALVDMGNWTGAVKKLLDSQFGTHITPDWSPSWINSATWIATPYSMTTNDGNGLLTPEYRTTPGWSGSNQIPLRVSGEKVVVDFQPLGPNMTCQLCYRTADGATIYGTPVNSGECSLMIDQEPANSVVFAVITNTDYIYKGEVTRTTHFNYRLQLGEGVLETADIHKKWYDWTKVIAHTTDIKENNTASELVVYPNPVSGSEIYLNENVDCIVYNSSGIKVFSGKHVSRINISGFYPGIYIIVTSEEQRARFIVI